MFIGAQEEIKALLKEKVKEQQKANFCGRVSTGQKCTHHIGTLSVRGNPSSDVQKTRHFFPLGFLLKIVRH
jgi:hypothetical protein